MIGTGSITNSASNGTGIQSSATTAATNQNQMTAGGYMSLFLNELQNQDPTQPMSTASMMQQEAQLTTMQENTQMEQDMNSLTTAISGLEIEQGNNLIGQQVTGNDANGNSVTGKVTKLSLQNGSVYLTVGNSQIALNQISTMG